MKVAHDGFTKNVTLSAKKDLKEAKCLLTLNMKRAIRQIQNRQRYGYRMKKKYKYTKSRMQTLKVKEQNEQEVLKFYDELQNYEIMRSNKFLKKFMRGKEPTKLTFLMKKIIEDLESTEVQPISIGIDNESLTKGPTR